MSVYLYILSMIIKYWIFSNIDNRLIITMHGHKTLWLKTKFSQQAYIVCNMYHNMILCLGTQLRQYIRFLTPLVTRIQPHTLQCLHSISLIDSIGVLAMHSSKLVSSKRSNTYILYDRSGLHNLINQSFVHSPSCKELAR